ncbi:hypothetical protein niasHS_002378 [Heterodera schachtii]|uniref:Trafficking protein particle complex subunit 9 n=1 Tax=Heterodera schachtii TaxID=97005 RepID=A0ABD2KJS4_HETSC
MDSFLPKPEDHCRIQILVKPLGNFSVLSFGRLVKALERRFTSVHVSSNVNSQRQILPKLVTELDLELTRFGEFQAFRKVFGLLCVGQFNGGGPLNCSSSSPDLNSPTSSSSNEPLPDSPANSPSQNRLRRSSLARFPPIFTEREQPKSTEQNSVSEENYTAESKQFNLLKEQFAELKQSLKDQLVDSRCALFGFNSSSTTEFLSFPGAADDFSSLCDHLESVLHELLRSIYFVLESRRLDTSFERVETPPCPLLPDEEKYRMGLENVKSKAYRKKCIGRLRKKTGDYAFLTGLFEAAVLSYQSAIDLLKSTADLLWLAAAYEGWCCAAFMVKYKQRMASNRREENEPKNVHQNYKVRTVVDAFAHQSKASLGHQRYCSDEVAKIAMDNTTVDVAIGEENASRSPTDGIPSHNQSLQGPSEDETDTKNLSNSTSFFTGKNSSRRKAWRHFLNFDSSHSAQSAKIAVKSDGLPLPSAMSSASRSSSAHNLASPSVPNPPISAHNQSPSTSNGLSKSQNVLISRNELSERFRAALENYGRFSFVVCIEYECVMRAVHLLVFHRQFVEVESFLREHTCRFLDDKFLTFDNIMKSNICLAASEVYKMIGFKRKCAFFLRLAVFFRLFIENHSENDYKKVYPILNESLFGYGIGGKFSNFTKEPKGEGTSATFSLQIKAVHEVCTVAVRAGLHNMAIRHLCFMLESFFDHLDKAALLSLVEELNKLTKFQSAQFHVLSVPLSLDSSPPVLLAPLQLTRIPALKDFRVVPLPSHLAPKIVEISSRYSKIFIYSPFQERAKKDELCWVVDCASEVSVKVQNPLPVDLIVNNLTLITEGCHFEHIPIRLSLPSCFGPCIGPTQSEVKLLGVPRSTGTLKIIGYACEVLGCKNLCKFPSPNTFEEPNRNHRQFSVRVLPPLPSLRIESSLQRSPTLSENPNDSIAELCVFTGQSYFHTITLCNSSSSVGIKHITIKIQQPQTCAGPMLFQMVSDESANSAGGHSPSTCRIDGLKPGERKSLNIRVFGIDPSSTPFSDNRSDHRLGLASNPSHIGQAQRVFVRRPTSTSSSTLAIVAESDALPHAASSPSTIPSSGEGRKPRLSSAESAPLLERESSSEEHSTDRHDLIPYVGRLLSAEFSFSYSADLEMLPVEEEFVRFAKLPMAVTIVPAVNVSSWNILPGDNPFSRFVIVDVANETDLDAELTFGAENRSLTVQPKEISRVPLLCPCCDGIPSAAFQRAAKQASHMMQMQEIERLRRKMETHLTKHLEIRWTIARLRLDGQVPIGSLLSSVSFLRRLALPSITIDMLISDKKCATDEHLLIGMGEFVPIRVIIYCSLGANLFGELSLSCCQYQNENSAVLNRENVMLICGEDCVPFRVSGSEEEREGDNKCQSEEVPSVEEQQKMGKFETEFHAAFSHEGIFKVRPMLAKLKFADDAEKAGRGRCQMPSEEDIFLASLSVDVTRKL